MAWAAVASGAAGALVGGLLGGGRGGGTQTQSASREPWGPAQPWLQQNIGRGQALQNFYQANPFSGAQKTAYNNQFTMSDAYRAMLPQLMAGMNTQTFDRTNPLQRPTMQSFAMPQAQVQNLGFIGRPTYPTV